MLPGFYIVPPFQRRDVDLVIYVDSEYDFWLHMIDDEWMRLTKDTWLTPFHNQKGSTAIYCIRQIERGKARHCLVDPSVPRNAVQMALAEKGLLPESDRPPDHYLPGTWNFLTGKRLSDVDA